MEPVWAEVDLAAIRHNFKALRSLVSPQVQLMAVVKANAYGHGAVPVAKELLASGASQLAVARVSEAVELREAGVDAPIVLLGLIDSSEVAEAIAQELTVPVTSIAFAQKLSAEAEKQGKRCFVQVKVDTGMGRIGLFPQKVPAFIRELSALPGLFVEGVFSHLATADEADPAEAKEQIRIFRKLKEELRAFQIPYFHIANSAAILNFPEAQFDLVRPGIALYGLWPSQFCKGKVELVPALTWKARLREIRQLPAGFGISYGHTYQTKRATLVGTVAVGYGDGYSRLLSNHGQMLIGGRRVPILGRVCMDQTMVDLTELAAEAEVRVGSEVVLLGKQGSEEITADELAEKMGTIAYEVTCLIGSRVERVYL